MGEVEAERVVPLEESHPWPNDVWPVPPLVTASVPVVLERATFMEEVAIQEGLPVT